MFARMETPLSVFLFLIVLIQLFSVHQAAIDNSTNCRIFRKPYTTRVPKTDCSSRSNETNGPLNFTVAHCGFKTTFVTGHFICCAGFVKIQDNPVTCISACLKYCTNGICNSSNECECNIGYKLDLNNKYNCLPICSTPCGNGTCTAPENCSCTEGYTFTNKTCQPVCTKPCTNGVCIAPNICQCSPGYQESGENICKPHCSSGCPHGTCVGPETCSCNSGWKMIQANGTINHETCEPICSKPCINGTITYICDPGWYKSNLSSTYVVDTIEFDKNTGVKDWVQSNWIVVLASATAISVLVLSFVIFIIIRYKRNKSHEDGGATEVPLQEFSANVFNKAKGDYNVCNKNSVL